MKHNQQLRVIFLAGKHNYEALLSQNVACARVLSMYKGLVSKSCDAASLGEWGVGFISRVDN